MIKKEVSEIKKLFGPATCCLSRICGCYVDNEKQQKMTMKEAFLSLPEEEEFKYFEIFKKALSGKIGKNLLNLAFPLAEEKNGICHPLLLKLKDTQLGDDDVLDEFYEKIIDHYLMPDGCGYLIILAYGMYDIPGKASDGTDMFDASEEVYSFIIGAICPFTLSKPGLSYSPDKNRIENNERDMMVSLPLHGFLFPTFNDRTSDIHEMLYYTKSAEGAQEDFVKNVFGCGLPMTPGEQKDAFQIICAGLFDNGPDFQTAAAITGNLTELSSEKEFSRNGDTLSKRELKKALENSGVNQNVLERFDSLYDKTVKAEEVLAVSNLVDTGRCLIKAEDIEIRMKPDCCGRIGTRIIDGRPCIVIETDGNISINGIDAKAL